MNLESCDLYTIVALSFPRSSDFLIAIMEKLMVHMVVAIFSFGLSLSAPSAPLNFALSQVPMRPMELEARWTIPEEPNGVILSYTVMCNGSEVMTSSMTFGGSDVQLGRENEISVTLVGLDPFTVYECSVSAATNGGVGDASETAVARTEQDGELTTMLTSPPFEEKFVVFLPIY